MVCLRGHYFIDLISGVIFAHYIWMMSERYSYLVDVKLFSIPFKKRFPMYTHSCVKCQHPVTLWVDQNETQDCIPCGDTDSLKFSPQQLEKNSGGEKYHPEVDKERYQVVKRTSL